MSKRKIARIVQKARDHQKIMFPYKECTRLIDLVKSNCHGDVRRLVDNLRPYLMDGEGGYLFLTRLYFDEEKIQGVRKNAIKAIAEFLIKVKNKNGFSKHQRQSTFFRYLSDPIHCNLGISEKSLKALIAKEKENVI